MYKNERSCPLTQQQIIACDFLAIRARVLDVAAFLDRLQRSVERNAEGDFRVVTLQQAFQYLATGGSGRVQTIQMLFSDPTTEPLLQLDQKSAYGAFDPRDSEVRQ